MMLFVVVQSRDGNFIHTEPVEPGTIPFTRGMILANRYFPSETDVEIGDVWADTEDSAASNQEGIRWRGSYKTPKKEPKDVNQGKTMR